MFFATGVGMPHICKYGGWGSLEVWGYGKIIGRGQGSGSSSDRRSSGDGMVKNGLFLDPPPRSLDPTPPPGGGG